MPLWKLSVPERPSTSCYVLEGCQDGPVSTIIREARKHDTHCEFCGKGTSGSDVRDRQASGCDRIMQQLMNMQQVEDMLKLAEEKGEPPFLIPAG